MPQTTTVTFIYIYIYIHKYMLLYTVWCIFVLPTSVRHINFGIRITKPAVPCLSHDPVAAWLSFTVIVSKVRYKHTRPGDGGYETVLLDHPIAVCAAAAAVCVCVCASLYNQRLRFYFNTLHHRLVTLRVAAPEGHVTVLVGFNR